MIQARTGTHCDTDGNRLVHDDNIVVLGQITGLYGVRGWFRIYSDTSPRDNILSYSPWLIRQPGKAWREVTIADGRTQGKGIIAHLQGYDDREAARRLIGAEIAVYRNQLVELGQDEYYWTDLQGLKVITTDGQELGIVDHVFATGANDVLVVTGERERLIPFIQGLTIIKIDLRAGCMQVDWDPDF